MLGYQLDTTVIYVLKWRPGDVSNSETRGGGDWPCWTNRLLR